MRNIEFDEYKNIKGVLCTVEMIAQDSEDGELESWKYVCFMHPEDADCDEFVFSHAIEYSLEFPLGGGDIVLEETYRRNPLKSYLPFEIKSMRVTSRKDLIADILRVER